MNKEQTKQAIEVMQAWLDGKTIQVVYPGMIIEDCDSPSWQWNVNRYRVKPVPQVYYLYTPKDEPVFWRVWFGETFPEEMKQRNLFKRVVEQPE